jgi:isoprenylcysteine carboxyl methyltransferase (ICMT) family protein YpbQ
MFIYAGFTMLISAGNSQKIAQAKNILVAAVIGLAIVFSSYLIIKFVLAALGYSWTGDAPS